ncbi:hypothetical protein, partial [Longibacter sp.]|uniref:hypothetical protein n=1 Tax=Longibacter sp. TaxID=2045415 RepID=UPI003EB8C2E2
TMALAALPSQRADQRKVILWRRKKEASKLFSLSLALGKTLPVPPYEGGNLSSVARRNDGLCGSPYEGEDLFSDVPPDTDRASLPS